MATYIYIYYIIYYIYVLYCIILYILYYIIYNILYYIYYIIYIICTYKYIFFPPLTLVPRGFAAKSALPLGDAMNFRWNMRSRAWRHVELHCWRWGGGFLDDCWLVIYTIYMAFIWHLYLVSIIYTIYIYIWHFYKYTLWESNMAIEHLIHKRGVSVGNTSGKSEGFSQERRWWYPAIHIWLVVWNMKFMTFHSVGNVIIPTDFHSIIFQRGRSTTNQI